MGARRKPIGPTKMSARRVGTPVEFPSRSIKKVETRRRLIAIARKMFVETGYHQTTVQNIARSASVANGTFYLHFEDKADCFMAVLEDVEYEVLQTLDWHYPSAATPAATLSSCLNSLLSYSKIHPGVLRALMSDSAVVSKKYKRKAKVTQPLNDRWYSLLQKWQRSGKAAPDFDVKFFSYVIGAVFRVGESVLAHHPEREEELVAEMTRLLVRAIKAE